MLISWQTERQRCRSSAASDIGTCHFVDDPASDLSAWTRTIFDFGETAWREYQSAAWYVDAAACKKAFRSRKARAACRPPSAPTGRTAAGVPTIGMYAEYDAVPGNCQDASTVKRPRPGLSEHAGGHTDPHSGLGIASLGGLLATKAAMERHGIAGTLRFTGEPAEKVRGSKPIHAAKGYYDGLDGMISFHPFYMLPLCNTVRWDTHCGAAYSMIYRFICDQPERWGLSDGAPIPQSHSAVRAPGANDALMMMYMASKALRDSMLPHQGGWSISEAILTAGQATADNLPAGLAEIQYMMRVPTIAMAEQVTAVLDRNAEHAAAMTGCRVRAALGLQVAARPRQSCHGRHRLGGARRLSAPPRWDEAAKAIAREIQVNAGVEAMDEPFIDECEQLISTAGGRSDPAPRPAAVADQLDVRRLHRHDLARADGALLCRPPGAEGARGLSPIRAG